MRGEPAEAADAADARPPPGQETTILLVPGAGPPAEETATEAVFLARNVSGALTAKAGCSAVPWKAVGWRKAFLKARLTSEPPGLAGAAATLFSVWKSAQSLCAGQRRDRGAGGSHTSQAGSSGRNRRAPAIALAGGPFPRPALHPSHPHHSPGERPWGLPRRAQQGTATHPDPTRPR